MLRDLRLGARNLMREKSWTAVIVISLALGIGASTAIFSAVNGLLLRKLPVDDPDTLVRLRYAGPNDMATSRSDYGVSRPDALGRDVRATFSYPMYLQFVAANRTMTDLFACAPVRRLNVIVDGHADVASGFVSTGNYYQVLGVSTRIGRTLLPDDDRPNAPAAAVISHRYWRSRFAGQASVLGKVVRIGEVPVTIVGVLQPEYTGVQRVLGEPPDLGLPLTLGARITEEAGRPGERPDQATRWWLQVMGRLKPGVAAEQVEANLNAVFRHTARAGFDSLLASLPPAERSLSRYANRRAVPDLKVDSGSRGVYDVAARELQLATILSVVVLLVLLLVCANVANLLLSRATSRQKELSVRLSLGATRLRLVRQLLTESLLLACVGGALAVAVGYWGKRLLPGGIGERAPLDATVLGFVLLATTASGLLFGIVPALRASGADVNAALKDQSRTFAGSRTRLGKSLLVFQVAVSLVLLIGAGLLLRTIENLRNVDVGFNPNNVVLFRISPGLNNYDQSRSRAIYRETLERLETLPGVRSAALSDMAMLSGAVSSTGIFVQGRAYEPGVRADNGIHRLTISPAFFEVMEVRLLLGRTFTDRDHDAAPKVAVINEAAARKYFPDENPIGRRFGTSIETSHELEIVGVVGDIKYEDIRAPAPPTMYVPYTQRPTPSAAIEVRTTGDPLNMVGPIRSLMRQIDPHVPVTDVSTQAEQFERRFLQEKVFARAYSLFGGLALIVAAVGLFGLMSYSVSRRTNEIGIRMALGAQQRDVLRLVMRESMVLVLAGVIIGVGVAIATGRLIAALLFGLSPTDATTMAAAVTLMVVVSALAGYLPARRAARVDPITALRYE